MGVPEHLLVDFLVVDKSRGLRLPVEVTFQGSLADWDFQVIEKAFGGGTIVTRDAERRRPRSLAVPAHRFLEAGP